jgi:hypothetical protein
MPPSPVFLLSSCASERWTSIAVLRKTLGQNFLPVGSNIGATCPYPCIGKRTVVFSCEIDHTFFFSIEQGGMAAMFLYFGIVNFQLLPVQVDSRTCTVNLMIGYSISVLNLVLRQHTTLLKN